MITRKQIDSLPEELKRALVLGLEAGNITKAQALRIINRHRPDRSSVITNKRRPVSTGYDFAVNGGHHA